MILIIGGDSKIGRKFYDYLKQKSYKVIKTTRNFKKINNNNIYFNLERPEFEDKFLQNISVVYFFAGISNINYCEDNKNYSHHINFKNTRKTIKFFIQNKIRVFFISTSKVYGINSKFPNESHKKYPQNYYALLKLRIEKEFQNKKLFTVLRIGKVLYKDYHKELFSKNLNIKGNYFVSKDFYISPIYINNLCYIMLKLYNLKNVYGILNICSNDSLSYYDLYQYMKTKYKINNDIFFKENFYKSHNAFKELMNTKKIKKLGIRIFNTKTHLDRLIKSNEI